MPFVKYEPKGDIAYLVIDRPEALNALNAQVLADLDAALDAIDLDLIRCVILRGAGDNLYVALIATICVSVVRPIMAVFAVYVLHLGLTGTWIFGLAEIVLRFAFFYPRFASGKWKDKKV